MFFLSSPIHSNLYFFLPVECWNFSSGNLDIHKGSLIQRWLFKSVFSKGFETMVERKWNWSMRHCRIYSQDQGLWAYFPLHMWARLLLGPLAYDARCHSSPKGILSMDGCQTITVEGVVQMRGLIQPCCWHHSKNKIFIKIKRTLHLGKRNNNSICKVFFIFYLFTYNTYENSRKKY